VRGGNSAFGWASLPAYVTFDGLRFVIWWRVRVFRSRFP
jgi:hypothetical protein